MHISHCMYPLLFSLLACSSTPSTSNSGADTSNDASAPVDAARVDAAEPDASAKSDAFVDAMLSDGSDTKSDAATTCVSIGCNLAQTCAACPTGLVCDDRKGSVQCVTTDTFFSCGTGTRFCNSSCGVCILSAANCGINSCDANATKCGGAKCGAGTHCDSQNVCVPN